MTVTGQIIVNDQRWLIVRDANSRISYLAPDAHVLPWQDWWRANQITGTIDGVLSDYRLRIGGKIIKLFGVREPQNILGASADAAYRRMLKRLWDSQIGNEAKCEPQTTVQYSCFINGRDLAELLLLNGAAMVDDQTTPDYVEMQTRAAVGHRGLWTQQ